MEPLILTENSRISIPSEIISSSPEETFALGGYLAAHLEKGSIVALEGALGAGKTLFAKGIAGGLGIMEELTSPTYTIISEYQGFLPWNKNEPVPVYHIDAYRLGGDDDFSAIGGEEIVFGNGISIIEWCSHIPGFILPSAFRIDFEILEGDKRVIRINAGPSGQ